MLKLVWIVPALPLAGFVVNLFVGKRLGKGAGWLASALMFGSLAVAILVARELLTLPAGERVQVLHLFDWIDVGTFRVGVDLRVDALSVTMILVVTAVGSLIHLYSIGYMEGDPRFGRFFAYLNLFCSFMLTLVLAENLLILYVGWEGVGLCSYLLIGFWFERTSAANAAKKAFVTTRIGDTFMLVGIALVFLRLGSLDFSTILSPEIAAVQPSGVFTILSLLLFAGAVGKSAQIPLHVWLPDAMEGPTPVSALIHAATMVTAGVYLVVRTHLLFEISGVALTVVLVVGLVTAVYAGLCALAQDDIKRVLAYSTISQLGFMFMAAGLEAYAAAIFMLAAHAAYKALLFLSAGSVMHGTGGEADLRRMGGLWRPMPWTAGLMTIGGIALSGVFGLSGYFAKDSILAIASEEGKALVYWVGLAAAFLSALYIGRLVVLALLGGPRSEEARHAHESPPIMIAPLVVLGLGALGMGTLALNKETGLLPLFLEPVVGGLEVGTAGLPEYAIILLSQVVALSGLVVAWFVYGGRVDWLAVRARVPNLQRFLQRGMYVDDAYAAALVVPGKAGSAFLAYAVDLRIIDGTVNAFGGAVEWAARTGRRIQTGLVRNYALAFLLGAVVLLAYVGSRL